MPNTANLSVTPVSLQRSHLFRAGSRDGDGWSTNHDRRAVSTSNDARDRTTTPADIQVSVTQQFRVSDFPAFKPASGTHA